MPALDCKRPATDQLVLLTGRPGVGKTTVIRGIAERLPGIRLGGFYTQELRESGVRKGFRLVRFDGASRVIAHVDAAAPTSARVGKYGVDVSAIDTEVEHALAPGQNVDLYLIDEIGKMECLSPRFVAIVRRLLDGEIPIVATIAFMGGAFIAEVKSRENRILYEVTLANRDRLPERIASWLHSRLGERHADA